MRIGVLTAGCILGISLTLCSSARAVTLHFDELPQQDANGVSIAGVTFSFTPDIGETLYNFNMGIPTLNLTDPVLDGDTAGTLALSFAQPSTNLSFDIVLGTTDTVTDGYNVTLTNQGLPVYSQGFDVSPGFVLAEAVFSYSGVSFDLATISFPNTLDAGSNAVESFAIDNLTFNTPEPGTIVLLPVGLMMLGLAARRDHNK